MVRRKKVRTEIIARAAHEIVRAYYSSINFFVPVWEDVPEWHASATINAVLAVVQDPEKTSEEHHATWMDEKLADGWTLSETEDVEAREHPYLIPYEDLPHHKKSENAIFLAAVNNLLDLSWALVDDQ